MDAFADDLFEAPVPVLVDEDLPDEAAWPPPGAELVLSGVVRGMPKPAGSKVSGVATRWDPKAGKRVPIPREGGKGFKTFTKDDSGPEGEAWRTDIRAAVLAAWGDAEPLDGALALALVFYAERPKGHYGTGRNAGVLKDSAPPYPKQGKLSDGTKLARAFEDALNKVVWTDDRRFVDFRWARRYGTPRAEYWLYRLPETGGVTPEGGQTSLSSDVVTLS